MSFRWTEVEKLKAWEEKNMNSSEVFVWIWSGVRVGRCGKRCVVRGPRVDLPLPSPFSFSVLHQASSTLLLFRHFHSVFLFLVFSILHPAFFFKDHSRFSVVQHIAGLKVFLFLPVSLSK